MRKRMKRYVTLDSAEAVLIMSYVGVYAVVPVVGHFDLRKPKSTIIIKVRAEKDTSFTKIYLLQ